MDPVIEQKLNEMGRGWEDFKHAHATLQEEVKKLNTEDTVLKEHIKKASEDVAAKHEEIQTLRKEIEAVHTKLNRAPIMGADEMKSDAEQRRDAFNYFKTQALIKKTYVDDESVTMDLELFKVLPSITKKFYRFGDKNMRSDVEMKALSVGNDPDGGFLVRPQWANYIIEKIYETSPIRQLANIETVSSPEFKIPIDLDEAGAGWVGETQSRPETSTPTLREKSILAHELYALPKATQTILEDAAVDIEKWLANKVSEKFSRVENNAFVIGNGVAKPRGFLTYPDNGTTVGTQGVTYGKIEQIPSGSAGLPTLSQFTNAVGHLKEFYHANARWVMKREVVPTIMLLQDGAGRYIFQPIFSMGYANNPLLGYQIQYAYDMPTLASGSLSIAFGDFKVAYTIVDRIGIQVLRDPYLYKPFVGFYTRKRVGGDVVQFDAIKLLKMA